MAGALAVGLPTAVWMYGTKDWAIDLVCGAMNMGGLSHAIKNL